MKDKDKTMKHLIKTYEELFIKVATHVPLELLTLQDPTDGARTISTSLANEIDKLRSEAVELRDSLYPKDKSFFILREHI